MTATSSMFSGGCRHAGPSATVVRRENVRRFRDTAGGVVPTSGCNLGGLRRAAGEPSIPHPIPDVLEHEAVGAGKPDLVKHEFVVLIEHVFELPVADESVDLVHRKPL